MPKPAEMTDESGEAMLEELEPSAAVERAMSRAAVAQAIEDGLSPADAKRIYG